MMNKKGSSWWTWIWIIVFVVIMISVARHSYYRQATYNDITGRITIIMKNYKDNKRKPIINNKYKKNSKDNMNKNSMKRN